MTDFTRKKLPEKFRLDNVPQVLSFGKMTKIYDFVASRFDGKLFYKVSEKQFNQVPRTITSNFNGEEALNVQLSSDGTIEYTTINDDTKKTQKVNIDYLTIRTANLTAKGTYTSNNSSESVELEINNWVSYENAKSTRHNIFFQSDLNDIKDGLITTDIKFASLVGVVTNIATSVTSGDIQAVQLSKNEEDYLTIKVLDTPNAGEFFIQFIIDERK